LRLRGYNLLSWFLALAFGRMRSALQLLKSSDD